MESFFIPNDKFILMGKKKVEDDDEGADEEVDEEEDGEFDDEEDFEEEPFTCRMCNKQTLIGDGDDIVAVCDTCLQFLDEDKIWDDYDNGVIADEELKTFDFMKYLSKLGKKKYAKK